MRKFNEHHATREHGRCLAVRKWGSHASHFKHTEDTQTHNLAANRKWPKCGGACGGGTRRRSGTRLGKEIILRLLLRLCYCLSRGPASRRVSPACALRRRDSRRLQHARPSDSCRIHFLPHRRRRRRRRRDRRRDSSAKRREQLRIVRLRRHIVDDDGSVQS